MDSNHRITRKLIYSQPRLATSLSTQGVAGVVLERPCQTFACTDFITSRVSVLVRAAERPYTPQPPQYQYALDLPLLEILQGRRNFSNNSFGAHGRT